ncbi:MAG TPA: ubiquitin-like domain-containing protein, partial [Anaerolineales bacterium]|nr:ubiquitin-like domain-containing protein [Anaerolineales bacterium]
MQRLSLRLIPSISLRASLLAVFLAASLLVSCRSPQVTSKDITISITADGATRNITIPAGSTVTQALQSAGVALGNLDRVEPPAYTV